MMVASLGLTWMMKKMMMNKIWNIKITRLPTFQKMIKTLRMLMMILIITLKRVTLQTTLKLRTINTVIILFISSNHKIQYLQLETTKMTLRILI